MWRTRLLPTALLLISTLGIVCTDSGNPIAAVNPPSPDDTSSSSAGINGPHTGEIWVAGISFGSERFNLQTGETVKVSEGLAFPSRDGKLYVEYLKNHETGPSEYCAISWDDIHRFNVKNTRTGSVTGTFGLNRKVSFPVSLSPDGERVAMYVAEDAKDCGSNFRNVRFTVFSKDGEQLYRDTNESSLTFDWHPQGYLLRVKRLSSDANQYSIQMETNPGSYDFVSLFSWIAPPEVSYYRGLQVGPSGKDAVLEAVLDKSHFLSGLDWRNARAHHFQLFEDLTETDMFQHKVGDTPRVNSPTFSPDGKHILVTEGYFSGSLAYNAHFPELDVLGSFDVYPASGESTSYIVPAAVKLQPMPPTQYSEKIRPVFGSRKEGAFSTIGFNPIYGLSWTPAID